MSTEVSPGAFDPEATSRPSALSGSAIAPPTAPGPYTPPRPVWPTVIGIITIIVGGGGVLSNAWGAAGLLIFSGMNLEWFARLSQPGIKETLDAVRPWQFRLGICSAVSILISAMLLCAGIGVFKRRRWCRPLIPAWSALRIAACIVQAILTYFMSQAQFAAMAQSGKGLPPGFGSMFGTIMGSIGAVFTILWGAALPVLLLIWFARPAIRAQVSEWASSSSPA